MSLLTEWFRVDGLDVELLLSEWRGLCPAGMSLLARNVFGGLFVQDKTGSVFWLNTSVGKLTKVASSKVEFLKAAESDEKRREWFVEQEAVAYANRGLIPNSFQCIGFGVPAIFKEGGTPDTAFIADIHEHVSFLGDLHQQIANLPDGSKVRLVIGPKPSSSPE